MVAGNRALACHQLSTLAPCCSIKESISRHTFSHTCFLYSSKTCPGDAPASGHTAYMYQATQHLLQSFFNPACQPSCCTPHKSGITTSGTQFHSFWAPSTKTKPHSEIIMWMDSKCPLSAKWAFDNHIKLIPMHQLPLTCLHLKTWMACSFINSSLFFLDRCNEIWSSTSLNCLGGHSFHIGGTTHVLLIGMDPFIVMVQGRWKSTAFLEYWHNCEDIILTFIGFSYHQNLLCWLQCLHSNIN